MELPQRKENRISNYDYSQNGAYFVTICTQNRRKFLSDIVGDDAHIVPKPCGIVAEEWLRKLPNKYPEASVDKYVIMPDHIHILLRLHRNFGTGDPSPTLGNVIGWYKYQVTKQVNLHFNQQGGKLFQRSYYDHVIRNQQDYDEIWQYIENNPRKWTIQNCEYE